MASVRRFWLDVGPFKITVGLSGPYTLHHARHRNLNPRHRPNPPHVEPTTSLVSPRARTILPAPARNARPKVARNAEAKKQLGLK